MNIKQQKQINAFLTEQFGEERGVRLYAEQEKLLDTLIGNTTGKSENQMKTLVQTLLPRIAMYKVLLCELSAEGEAYACMR